MNTIQTKDETRIFYQDWGEGQPIVFSHGWPLNGDAWGEQMLFFASRRYRCIPTLILHGDDDQIVPIAASALRSVELVKQSKLQVYAGAPHGLTATHREQFNADLLAFIQS